MTTRTKTSEEAPPRSVPPPDELHLDRAARARTRRTLEEAAQATDALLLSGGLDSSIAAVLCGGLWTKAYCVTLPGAPDEPYAREVAEELGLDLHAIEVTVDQLEERLELVTDGLGTFDPMRVRNAVVPFVALEVARDHGVEEIATGDGADELFAGYSYMREMDADELDAYRGKLADRMSFSTPVLAHETGLEAVSPFLHEATRALARELDARHLVREHRGRRVGKWILREAFADELPEEVLWQRKDPIERGSGSRALAEHFAERLDEETLAETIEQAREEGVRLRDAEHAAYYRAYRASNPPPGEARPATAVECRGCRAPLDAAYCRVRGHQNEAPGPG